MQRQNHCTIGPNSEVVFDTQDQLGRGAIGIVYGGIMNKDPNYRVAVKKLDKKGNQMKKLNTKFQKTCKIQQKLNNPYITKYYFTYLDDKTGTFYIVTERCSSSIQQYILSKQTTAEKTFKYAYQLIMGMKYLHAQGIMHRDIKPSNIMISQNDNVKIANFDLVKSNYQIQSFSQHTPTGTPIYASPQVVHQQKYSGKCDVWSVGCLIYQMLTKKRLFGNGTTILLLRSEQKKFKEPEKKTQILSQIKDEFWNKILSKMLIYQDQQRPSFHELLAFFTQQNKKKYHIDKESEKQNKPQKIQPQTKNNKIIINNRKPIIRIVKNVDKISQQDLTKNIKKQRIITTPILRTPIQKIISDYAYLSKMMSLKYQKIKLTYKCIYQLQTLKHYPVTSFVHSIIVFMMLMLYKMEISDFWKEFNNDQFIIFQGKKLNLKGKQSVQVQIFFNTRNRIFNEFMDKIKMVDRHLKQYANFLLKPKYQLDQNTLKQMYPQIFDFMNQYASIETSPEVILQPLKKYFKQQGIPANKIDKMQQSQKLKTYILIGKLCFLFCKNTECPNKSPYDSNILNKKVEEIDGMQIKDILRLIERLK